MKGFLLCLGIILTSVGAKPEPSPPQQRSLEGANFDLLLDNPASKTNKDSKSFFEFKEAKILAQKKMEQDAPTPSVVAETSKDMAKSVKASRKLQRKTHQRPHPRDIKLDPRINELMPNVDALLADLKPQRSRRLLQKPIKTVKGRRARPTPVPAAELKAFSDFDQEVKAAATLSNQQLRRNYDRNLMHRQATAELNYQNFIRFASDRYMQTLTKVYNRNQEQFHQMQVRVADQLRQSIRNGIKAHTHVLDAQLTRRFQRVTRRKFERLTKDIESMQGFYNRIYAEDRRMVNKLMDFNHPVPASQDAWDAKDQAYIHANLKPDGKQ